MEKALPLTIPFSTTSFIDKPLGHRYHAKKHVQPLPETVRVLFFQRSRSSPVVIFFALRLSQETLTGTFLLSNKFVVLMICVLNAVSGSLFFSVVWFFSA
jgi:hypothetical protein